MTEGHATEPEQGSAGKTLKRRGILAVAAAAMAGIAAKQLAQPVGATTGGTNGTALIIGANGDTGNTPNTYAVTTVLRPTSGSSVGTSTPTGVALVGIGQDGEEGLYGICYGSNGFGVKGQTDSGVGVHGYATSTSATTAYGVYGQSDASAGYGVYGAAYGAAATGVGGEARGTAPAVFGQNTGSAASAGPGAQGTSTSGHGSVGVSGASDGHASVFGFSNKQGGIAVRGSIDPAVRVAPYTFAGVFDGTVVVSGSLFIGGNKSAYVKHPDGSHRALYCVESPESWFEDFGEGTLVNGKAEVKIDPDFAAVADTSAYHVFLTEHDQHNALHVTRRTGGGFAVEADTATLAAKGKKVGDVGGTFSYRIVARRKDVKAGRLAKVELPPAPKPPTTFVTPETPLTKPPEMRKT